MSLSVIMVGFKGQSFKRYHAEALGPCVQEKINDLGIARASESIWPTSDWDKMLGE